MASRIQQRIEELIDYDVLATIPFPLDAEVTGTAENDCRTGVAAAEAADIAPTMAYPAEPETLLRFTDMVAALRTEIAQIQLNLTTAETTGETFIENSSTKYIHRMSRNELRGSSATWRARGCGWKYGLHDYERLTALPEQPLLCPQCFGFRCKRGTATKKAEPAQPDRQSDESDSSSSSSNASDSSSSES